MDADLLLQTIAEVLKKIEDYSISNRAEFEALVKKNLAMQQTDQTKKQQKRIPQITTRLEQIDKVDVYKRQGQLAQPPAGCLPSPDGRSHL